MKLLMITRKVDRADGLAGFVYSWVEKIGQQVDRLYVITWQPSDRGDLPDTVEIINLPRNKFFKICFLFIQSFKILPRVDGIFCHMNPEYTIIVGPLARLFGKRVVSWYMHRSITQRMRLMEKITHRVLSASQASFRLPSKKLVITGHGIDTDIFCPPAQRVSSAAFVLLTVGRISPTKDYESMIKAVDLLNDQGTSNVRLSIIGAPGLANQQSYLASLREMTKKMKIEDRVNFLGSIANAHIPPHLQQADVFINLSGTGSLDKAVLEAMACECLVLTSNEAFAPVVPQALMVEKNNPRRLAEKIKYLLGLSAEEKNSIRKNLRQVVVKDHNLDHLVKKIITQYR